MIAAGVLMVNNDKMLEWCEAAYSSDDKKALRDKCDDAQYTICDAQGKGDICEVDMDAEITNPEAEKARQTLLTLDAVIKGLDAHREAQRQDVVVKDAAPPAEEKTVKKEEVKKEEPKKGDKPAIGDGAKFSVGISAGLVFGDGFKADSSPLTKQYVGVEPGINLIFHVDEGEKKDMWMLSADLSVRVNIPAKQYKSDGSEYLADPTIQPLLGLNAYRFLDDGRRFALGGGVKIGGSFSTETYSTDMRSASNNYFMLGYGVGAKWRATDSLMIGAEFYHFPGRGKVNQNQQDFLGSKSWSSSMGIGGALNLTWLIPVY